MVALSLGGAIDPHYFKDPLSGRDFLLWKEDKPMALQASDSKLHEIADRIVHKMALQGLNYVIIFVMKCGHNKAVRRSDHRR